MGREARRRAAIQMYRDGIRSLTPAERRACLCGHVDNPGEPIVIRCHKRARYQTPLGKRCFEHAISQATKKDGTPLVTALAKAEGR